MMEQHREEKDLIDTFVRGFYKGMMRVDHFPKGRKQQAPPSSS